MLNKVNLDAKLKKSDLKKLLDEVTPSFRSIPETEIGRPSSFAISACSET